MDNGLESRLLELQPEEDTSTWVKVKNEIKIVGKIAFPSVLCRITQFGAIVVTQAFIGHINDIELAAYSLVQAITVQFANGILLGMASATETLCGQAFGAKQYHMMGIYLQRSWIVNFVVATLLLPFFIFATPIYKLLGEEDDISEAAGIISPWFIGVTYSFVFTMTSQMFLQAQRRNMFIGVMSLVSFLFHLMASWILVDIFSWGVSGAMGALILSRWSLAIFGFIYIFGGWCQGTWTGFSKSAFADIIPVVKLSLSSGVMLCVQVWYNSILVLLAGYTNNATVNVSAFSICSNICGWLYMVSLGFMVAASVRVSNEVGGGNVKAAKFAIVIILGITSAIGLFFCIICLIFGRDIPYLFTSNDEVAEAAANLSVLLSITVFLSGLQAVFSGAAIGTGSQAKVAIVNICSYYFVGIPIGCILGYVMDLEIKGIWIGMMCGRLLQLVVLVYLTWNIDWDAEVKMVSNVVDIFTIIRGITSSSSFRCNFGYIAFVMKLKRCV